uniref:50S ribosomal protein L21, chloroplastic n=1 Tax=Zeugodacus cucurbitae TaxID=28588 RepID=A0A0A1WW05_ZEUCU
MQKLYAVLSVGFLCLFMCITFTNGQLLLTADRDTIVTLTQVDLESQDNEAEIVQDYIVDKLELPQLRWRVLQARSPEDKLIIFEMASVDDVKQIYEKAAKLEDKKIVIRDLKANI